MANRWNSLPDSLKFVGTGLGFKVRYDELMSGRRLGEGGGMMYGSVEVISNLGGQTPDFVPFY